MFYFAKKILSCLQLLPSLNNHAQALHTYNYKEIFYVHINCTFFGNLPKCFKDMNKTSSGKVFVKEPENDLTHFLDVSW